MAARVTSGHQPPLTRSHPEARATARQATRGMPRRSSRPGPSSLQHLNPLLFLATRGEVRIARQEAHARVPSQPGIVVARRADHFGTLEMAHRFGEPFV